MKCQYVGFRLAVGSGIPKKEVVDHLVALSGKSVKRANKDRFFSLGLSGDYVVGRWGCLRGRTKHVIADTKTKEMIWSELPEGYEVTAPNYFVFHRETFHGLYQRYPSSNSLQHFMEMLRSLTIKLRQPLWREALREARRAANVGRKRGEKARPIPESKKDSIDQQFEVSCHPLIRREKLEEVLSKWQAIKAFRFQVATVAPTVDHYGPLAEHTRAEVHELRLQPNGPGKGFVPGVVGMLAWLADKFKGRLRRTSLVGTDERSNTRTVNLGRFVDWLGENELDEVLTDKELDTKDVVKSDLIRKMISLCQERPEYFHKVAL